MSNLSQFLGGGGIKSIQRGSTTFGTNTQSPGATSIRVPINPVNLSRSVVTSSCMGNPAAYAAIIPGGGVIGLGINSDASVKLEDGITFVGCSGVFDGTPVELTNLESGDLVLYMGARNGANAQGAAVQDLSSSGWTALPADGNNPDVGTGNFGSFGTSVFYKFATGGTESQSVPLNGEQGLMYAFRGVDPTTPFDVTPIPRNTSTTDMSPPPITTVNKSTIVTLGYSSLGIVGIAYGLPSFSPPDGYFMAADTGTYNIDPAIPIMGVAFKYQTTVGLETPTNFKSLSEEAASTKAILYTIALRPAASTETSSALTITTGSALVNQSPSGIVDWQVIEYE